MSIISEITTSWAQTERELSKGTQAPEAFEQFLRDGQKSDWLREKIKSLKSEYEVIKRLVVPDKSKKSATPSMVLVDFDVVRAFIDDDADRNDYLHIRYFFENCELPYAIPPGAMREIRRYLLKRFHLSEIPVEIGKEGFESIAKHILQNLLTAEVDEGKLDDSRIRLFRLLRILQNPRYQAKPLLEETKSSAKFGRSLAHVMKSIKGSRGHYRLSDEQRDEIARNDALNLDCLLVDREASYVLLTTSSYLIKAAKFLPEITASVLRPRIMSLLSEFLKSVSSEVAIARLTECIVRLSRIDQGILQLEAEFALNRQAAGGVAGARVIQNQIRELFYEVKQTADEYNRIIKIEGGRAPLIGYEWIRDEIGMNSEEERREGATVSYVRMLTVIRDLVRQDVKSHSKYVVRRQLKELPISSWEVLREGGHVARGDGDVDDWADDDCRLCSIRGNPVDGADRLNMLTFGWVIDTGMFPFVSCVDELYMTRFRDAEKDDGPCVPFFSRAAMPVLNGVHLQLVQGFVLFPAAWIARQTSMRFLYPWQLKKHVVESSKGKLLEKSIRVSDFVAIEVVCGTGRLAYDLRPSSGLTRCGRLVTDRSEWADQIRKVWAWIGPGVVEIDRFLESVESELFSVQ